MCPTGLEPIKSTANANSRQLKQIILQIPMDVSNFANGIEQFRTIP